MSQRSALLEVRRLQGREFPPDNVNFNGRDYGLAQIYNDAGIALEVTKNQNDIPDLKGPNSSYSQAELHSLLTQFRIPPDLGEKMFAWLVVVTNYSEQEGILGIMFEPLDRKGTAVFQGHNLIRTDPRAFLRTSVHELGHQFNLHHEDGTTYEENGVTKYTIMNQTALIQPWPDAIGFKFGEHESTHLSSHPDVDVRPGGAAFYHCNEEHSTWHDGITST
ncbi:MAG: hypothetical protein WA364_19470 [Candidatus Nitrosopolaris sp.]